MASKKRKLFSFGKKAQEEAKPETTQRKFPKVRVKDQAAARPSDTDKIAKPVTGKVPKPETGKVTPKTAGDTKAQTTRISLPDDVKGRKVRRAKKAISPLPTDEIPSADQLREAAKNATARILIDTEDVMGTEASSHIVAPNMAGKKKSTTRIDTDKLAASSNTTRIDTGKIIKATKPSKTGHRQSPETRNR